MTEYAADKLARELKAGDIYGVKVLKYDMADLSIPTRAPEQPSRMQRILDAWYAYEDWIRSEREKRQY